MAFLHEHIILPLSDLFTGQRVHHYLRFLQQSKQWSKAQMADFQNERFLKLVNHAATNVPFYRDWFLKKGLSANEFHSIDDIVKLPIVDKPTMRREGIERFTADNISPRQRMVAHSSGSTGEPFAFYVSKEAYSVNTAAKLRTWYDVGYRLGDRFVKLSSSPRVSMLKKLQDRMSNGIILPFTSLDDNTLAHILDTIEQFQPTIIRTHPNAIYYLARYRKQHPGCYSFSPRFIMTTSSNLPDTFRELVKQVFQCDIVDSYSCEGTANTAENLNHDGYHVSHEYGIIEVLDDNGEPVVGGIGTVVSTDLWNYAMPFLRYNTQDLVQVDTTGTIQRIAGRMCELLEVPNGRRYTGQVIEDYFTYQTNHTVEAFQVVHRRNGSVLFHLMVGDGFTDDIRQKIINHWHSELEVPVEIKVVNHIPLMHNNKYLTIVEE